ncbi:MAG: prepilin-type N-terminal cleavage/methylation domain-containing protein [Deltaproteobacteria bacterium]|nr:prepilin-type N-terminal cleavage/methylation domain-containing protein [Deltaproteobacteria bacterium]
MDTRNDLIGTQVGFTLIELLIAIAVAGILLAIATPSFLQWRQNLQYKEAANGLVSTLRTARNSAISLNRQNRVEFQPLSARYRTTQGDRAYDSTSWTIVKQDWTAAPVGIVMKTGAGCTGTANVAIPFSPNGTASAGTICIGDNSSTKYQIVVAASGRIKSIRQ